MDSRSSRTTTGPRSGPVESTSRDARKTPDGALDDSEERIDEEPGQTPAEGHPDDREDELDGDDGGRTSVEAVHENPGHE
jgi:hypothetical protein